MSSRDRSKLLRRFCRVKEEGRNQKFIQIKKLMNWKKLDINLLNRKHVYVATVDATVQKTSAQNKKSNCL